MVRGNVRRALEGEVWALKIVFVTAGTVGAVVDIVQASSSNQGDAVLWQDENRRIFRPP